MIYDIRLENDEGHYCLLLDDSFGTHMYHVDPQMLHDALRGWREHMSVGESIRVERLAAGAPSWDEHRAYVCPDPEGDWIEEQRYQADVLRKRERENR